MKRPVLHKCVYIQYSTNIQQVQNGFETNFYTQLIHPSLYKNPIKEYQDYVQPMWRWTIRVSHVSPTMAS